MIESRMKAFKTKKILLIVVILCVVFSAVFAWLFLIIRAKNIYTDSLINESDAIIKSEKRLISQKSLLDSTNKERAKLASLLLDDNSAVAFIENIEKIAENNNIKVTIGVEESQVLKNKNDNTGISILKLHVEGEGSWSNLFRFELLLENEPYNISWTQVELSTDASLSETGQSLKQNIAGERKWRGIFDFSVLKSG